MYINNSIERIKRMRSGERIKCPRCEKGYISAVGAPDVANVFKCNKCGNSIVLTVDRNKKIKE